MPSIRRIHGNTVHCGKNSMQSKGEKTVVSEPTKEEIIKNLQTELDKAIKEQNFEYAAELRDKIKEMGA